MRVSTIVALTLALCVLPGLAAQDLPSPVEKTVVIPDTQTVVKVGVAEGEAYASLSRDGGQTFAPLERPDNQLHFHYATFDPAVERPSIPGMLRSGSANRLFIVQFVTQPLEEYRAGLKKIGAEIHQYLSSQAYLTRMSAAQASAARALPYVRFVGALEPAYKFEPEIVASYLRGDQLGPRRYNIMLVDRKCDEADLVAAIEQAGGKVDTYARGNLLLEATLDEHQLLEVAAQDTVLWVDRWSEPEHDMDNARIQGGANYIEFKKPESYVGKGVRGMIMEGIYATHTEFAAQSPYRTAPLYIGDSSPSGHGNSTCGEVFARGAQAKARGLVPYGQVIYCNYNYVYNNNNRYTVVQDLVDPAKQYQGMFQTASWGYSRTTIYTSRSAEMDLIIFDWDIPITQSQSNARDQYSRPQAWAKNIISVGGTNHYDNSNPGDDKWTSGSTGPAQDGRVKPDMCAYYDAIYTTGYGSTSYTSSFGGTSGATPIVCGHVGLITEMCTDGIFGHPLKAGPGWQNRFANRIHFTTTKALLINGAVPYPNPGRATKHDRFTQGWGFPSVQTLYDRRDNTLAVDEYDVLQNRQTATYYTWVPGTHGDLRVTMTYSDPETAPLTKIPHRINDLTLMVQDPGNVLYYGNNGLAISLSTNYSSAGGSADKINTVENVFLQNPTKGIWSVSVTAAEVIQDTHKETTAVDADFALVMSGIRTNRDQSGLLLGLVSSSTGDIRLSLSNLPAGWSEGWVLYSFDATLPAGYGHFLGIEPDMVSIACFFQPRVVGSPYHFAYTANKVFPNTVYAFDKTLATALKGLTVDAVAFVIDAKGSFLDVSNSVRAPIQ